MSENLWPNFAKNNVPKVENEVLTITKEQVKYLKNSTNRKVTASFTQVKRKASGIQVAVDSMARTSAMFSAGEEILENCLADKQDVNEWWNAKPYKFEIYNDSYHYRVFELRYREMFPVVLIPDADICDELGCGCSIEINSNEEYENYLKRVFASEKVTKIVLKLMEESK